MAIKNRRMWKAFKDTIELIETRFGKRPLSDLDVHKIIKRPEFIRLKSQCAQALQNNSLPNLSNELLDNLLMKQLIHGLKKEIETSYQQIEEGIYNFPLYHRVWFYLHQFDSEVDIINIAESFRIRRMTIFDHYYFIQEKEAFSGRSTAKFIFETKSGVIKPARNEDGSIPIQRDYPLKGWIHLFLNAVRLVQISSVGVKNLNYYVAAITEEDSRRVVGISSWYSPPAEFFPGILGRHADTKCVLNKEKIDLLEKLLKHLKSLPDEMKKEDFQTLLRALRRYNAALVSANIEDEVVDLIITLETLCKTSGFKMVYNVSYLIGFDEADRKNVMDTLDQAYSIRSRIVHGGSLKDTHLEIIKKIPSITQKALLFASVLGLSGEKLRERVQTVSFDMNKLGEHRDKLKEWYPISHES